MVIWVFTFRDGMQYNRMSDHDMQAINWPSKEVIKR